MREGKLVERGTSSSPTPTSPAALTRHQVSQTSTRCRRCSPHRRSRTASRSPSSPSRRTCAVSSSARGPRARSSACVFRASIVALCSLTPVQTDLSVPLRPDAAAVAGLYKPAADVAAPPADRLAAFRDLVVGAQTGKVHVSEATSEVSQPFSRSRQLPLTPRIVHSAGLCARSPAEPSGHVGRPHPADDSRKVSSMPGRCGRVLTRFCLQAICALDARARAHRRPLGARQGVRRTTSCAACRSLVPPPLVANIDVAYPPLYTHDLLYNIACQAAAQADRSRHPEPVLARLHPLVRKLLHDARKQRTDLLRVPPAALQIILDLLPP